MRVVNGKLRLVHVWVPVRKDITIMDGELKTSESNRGVPLCSGAGSINYPEWSSTAVDNGR